MEKSHPVPLIGTVRRPHLWAILCLKMVTMKGSTCASGLHQICQTLSSSNFSNCSPLSYRDDLFLAFRPLPAAIQTLKKGMMKARRASISDSEQGRCASPPNNEVMAGRAAGGPESFCGGGEFFVRPNFSSTDKLAQDLLLRIVVFRHTGASNRQRTLYHIAFTYLTNFALTHVGNISSWR